MLTDYQRFDDQGLLLDTDNLVSEYQEFLDYKFPRSIAVSALATQYHTNEEQVEEILNTYEEHDHA